MKSRKGGGERPKKGTRHDRMYRQNYKRWKILKSRKEHFLPWYTWYDFRSIYCRLFNHIDCPTFTKIDDSIT